METRFLVKYLSSVPVVATLAVVIIFTIFVFLNYWFPGLQYGTFFHPV